MGTNYNGITLEVFERAAAYQHIVEVMTEIVSDSLYMQYKSDEESRDDYIGCQRVIIKDCADNISALEDDIRKKQALIQWNRRCVDQARSNLGRYGRNE
jgi:hypothetical protein